MATIVTGVLVACPGSTSASRPSISVGALKAVGGRQVRTFETAAALRHSPSLADRLPAAAPVPPNAATNPDVYLYSVACGADSMCTAVGRYTNSVGFQEGLIVSGSASSWTATEAPLPLNANAGNPYAYLPSVACESGSMCTAVGSYLTNTGYTDGWIVSGSALSWTGREAPLPPKAAPSRLWDQELLQSVACGSGSACTAVGKYRHKGGYYSGLIVTGSWSTWTAIEAPLPANAATPSEAEISSVTCGSGPTCTAVGQYTNAAGPKDGLIVSGAGAAWTAIEAPVPANASARPGVTLVSVACGSGSTCTAVGGYRHKGPYHEGLIVTGSGSTWTATEAPMPANAVSSRPDPELFSVACGSGPTCTIVGGYNAAGVNNSAEGLIVTGSASTWRALETPAPPNGGSSPITQLYSVSCESDSTCTAVGNYFPPNVGAFTGFIVSGSGSTWTALETPVPPNAPSQPASALSSVSCESGSTCTAVGNYSHAGGDDGLIVSGLGSTWIAIKAPLPPKAASNR